MRDIDDKIQEAMSTEDKDTLDLYAKEPGLFGLIAESFRAKLKAIVISAFFLMIVFVCLLIYSAIQFFSTDERVSKLHWMAIAMVSLFVFGLLRLWYFMELNRLDVVSEIKRLEL